VFKGKLLGRFTEHLDRRIAAYKGAVAAARIEAPPELKFWYWTEFGTATRGEAGHSSGFSYDIDPVDAEALRFPLGGEMVMFDHVDHPGIRPHRSIRKVLPEIHQVVQERVRQALRAGGTDNPQKLREAMVDATTAAKALIVDSMAVNVPGRRELEPERGRLGGLSAAEVFEAKATVVDLSGED
jgi:hypothetical protein